MAKVLVIDDDPGYRAFVTQILRLHGYEVLEAEDGADGLRMAHDYAVEIVVTDIFMPYQDGIETIMALRRQDGDVRIIAMSEAEGAGDICLRAAGMLGADIALVKPFSAEELCRAALLSCDRVDSGRWLPANRPSVRTAAPSAARADGGSMPRRASRRA